MLSLDVGIWTVSLSVFFSMPIFNKLLHEPLLHEDYSESFRYFDDPMGAGRQYFGLYQKRLAQYRPYLLEAARKQLGKQMIM